jgi:3-oxoacyl-[acyl-carrier protein] reductase
LPLPARLERGEGPLEAQPLAGQQVVAGGAGGDLAGVVSRAVLDAGAALSVAGREEERRPYLEARRSDHPPIEHTSVEALADATPAGIVFDATAIREPQALRQLYDFFHPLVRRLARHGRVVVLARPPEARTDVRAAAASAALDGFVRSLAKELGRSGSTAQLLYVQPGAEARIAAPLRFFLSRRSAFITGQPVRVGDLVRAPASRPEVRPLEGKVALVTGAARGIGAATAAALAREGAHPIVLDRPQDEGAASELASRIGGSAWAEDVSDPEAPARLSRRVRDEHGGIDIVVHNAGVTRDKTLGRMQPEAWEQALSVNLRAILDVTGSLVDESLLRAEGRVVCLSSVAGIAGNMGQTNYAASKAGVIGFVRALAPSLAPRGITVNAVAPGFIETRMTAEMPVAVREVARRLSALGQGGAPEDVAEAVTFLSTPGADGITGGVLRVCGGAFVGA